MSHSAGIFHETVQLLVAPDASRRSNWLLIRSPLEGLYRMRYTTMLFGLFTAALLFFAEPLRGVAQTPLTSEGQLDADEIEVMALILEAAYVPTMHGWVIVGSRTATFQCNPPANIGINIGGCSGMRVATESPEERLAAVREEMPGVSAELAADLLRKNQRSTVITSLLPVRIQHILWAPGMAASSKVSGSPTLAIYFSRVGFDALRTKALIYFATMNWTDQSKSLGQYVYLEKLKGAWVIKAHAKVWG